jgi:hypothetical protein
MPVRILGESDWQKGFSGREILVAVSAAKQALAQVNTRQHDREAGNWARRNAASPFVDLNYRRKRRGN